MGSPVPLSLDSVSVHQDLDTIIGGVRSELPEPSSNSDGISAASSIRASSSEKPSASEEEGEDGTMILGTPSRLGFHGDECSNLRRLPERAPEPHDVLASRLGVAPPAVSAESRSDGTCAVGGSGVAVSEKLGTTKRQPFSLSSLSSLSMAWTSDVPTLLAGTVSASTRDPVTLSARFKLSAENTKESPTFTETSQRTGAACRLAFISFGCALGDGGRLVCTAWPV
mmetsp:Transcript_96287/g.171039  ORF Transcript_96287/g.171039 Transcript_96287/m.171039 type:complete len:226 (-) Transcript_96287:1809-2486(-)